MGEDGHGKPNTNISESVEQTTINNSSTTSATKNSESESKGDESLPKKPATNYIWMIKSCDDYYYEYKDCKSFRDRFHQYWVHGKLRDCTEWKNDYDNCLKWQKTEDEEALESVVINEKKRVLKRLTAHYANDVWEHRTSPPEDWAKELPEPITQEYKGSYLKIKADQLRNGEITLEDRGEHVFSGTRCIIL